MKSRKTPPAAAAPAAPTTAAPAKAGPANSEIAVETAAPTTETATLDAVTPSASLPGSTEELLASAKVTPAGTYVGEVPKKLGAMIMQGIAAEGISDATSISQALEEYIDGGSVEKLSVVVGGAKLTWVKFYSGDTEVGYLFDGATLKAIVGDGWISPV